MDFSYWLGTAISLSGLIIAFVGLNHRLKKDRQDHEERVRKELSAGIDDIKEKFAEQMSEIRAELNKEIDERDQENKAYNQRLSDRMDNLENRTFTTLLERLSRMEGELKGISNIVRIIQEKFIRDKSGD